MLTVKDLRNLLIGLDDEMPIYVCLCGPEESDRFHEAAEAFQEGETDVVHIRVPSPLRAVGGFQDDEGGILLVVGSPED